MPTLRWLKRDEHVRAAETVQYRLLEEDPTLGYGDLDMGNMLIKGDNLEALKALVPFYAGQVKCIYIDPPYNTGSAFEHYDDNLEHSTWLGMMYPRLELLRDLLAENGSIWVSIDRDEAHYLKVILDEVFGRKNFIADVVWQKRTSPDARLRLGDAHDYILVYGNSERVAQSFNKLPITADQATKYKNPDNDPRGAWMSTDLTGQIGHATPDQFYTITAPNGMLHHVPDGRCWAMAERTILKLIDENKIWFGKNGNARPRLKRFLSDESGASAWTWWDNKSVGHNQEAKKEVKSIFGEDLFDTPKPERLMERILALASNPGDLVLDSFLGSGTTAAVAQKMGRRFIGIELGDHAITHCRPRQVKVTDGEQGGISKAQNWRGGGGFRFYCLGSPVFDNMGHLQPNIRFPTLAAHIWFSEFNHPWTLSSAASPFLGVHKGRGVALLYNGILGEKSVSGGNVLTRKTLKIILDSAGGFDGPTTIYGERTVLADASLDAENIVFKQTPYDVRARK